MKAKDNESIGVGIVTCNRPNGIQRALGSLQKGYAEHTLLVNDGAPLSREVVHMAQYKGVEIFNNKKNIGVGKSKNRALRRLLKLGCKHIFLMEDDIYIKDMQVFSRYVETSKATGIQHLNFSQHGHNNKDSKGRDCPVSAIKYGSIEISLYPHCVGAFSYYSCKCLLLAGLIDEDFYNALDHVEHTYRIIKAGLHPPFWFFADISCSQDLLGDEEWSPVQSVIRSKSNVHDLIHKAEILFKSKHGETVNQIPRAKKKNIILALKKIQKKYGLPSNAKISITGPWRSRPSCNTCWNKATDRILRVVSWALKCLDSIILKK